MTQEKFLETLFDADERICLSDTPYGIATFPIGKAPHPTSVFFSINPMHTTRADANVTCFRNILLEIDSMPLAQQRPYIASKKIPVTSVVYSGGKSYHFILSLAQPCSTREEYDQLVRRLHKLLPEVDPTTKNPSRFSRLPDVIRPDTGKEQTLMYLGPRIPRATLEALLPPLEAPKTHEIQPEGFFSTLVVDAMFTPDKVMQKVGISGRNQFFFWLGQRLREGGATIMQKQAIVDQAYINLQNKADFSLQEARSASRVRE